MPGQHVEPRRGRDDLKEHDNEPSDVRRVVAQDDEENQLEQDFPGQKDRERVDEAGQGLGKRLIGRSRQKIKVLPVYGEASDPETVSESTIQIPIDVGKIEQITPKSTDAKSSSTAVLRPGRTVATCQPRAIAQAQS